MGPVFGRLGEEDAQYFREESEADMLAESTEALSLSFVVQWAGARVEEVNEVARGRVEAAAEGAAGEGESDNLR